MKYILPAFMTLSSAFNLSSQSLYDIQINDIDGVALDLNKFKGKYILFVNVASKCGFTKQYADLESLHRKYKKKLVIIGLPCNQFGSQEPGTLNEIKRFCTANYDVSFILTEKIEVRGDDKHAIYAWLTDKKLNGNMNSSVKWNFQKYFVNMQGELTNYFFSITSPLSTKITELLK